MRLESLKQEEILVSAFYRIYRSGLSIKDISAVKGVGGCPVQTFCGKWGKGSSDTDVRNFGAKTSDFLKFKM